MRRCHSIQHLQKETYPGMNIEATLIAITVNLLAVDILQHKIGLAGVGYTGVDQFGDMRISEKRENPAFASETILSFFSQQRDVQKLQRHTPIEPSVVAPGKPHAAHAALPDLRLHLERADNLSDHRCRSGRQINMSVLEESIRREDTVLR